MQIYKLEINDAQYNKGNYVVNLANNDSAGNPINFDGRFADINDTNSLAIAGFVPVINTSASAYPGLEFTITFRNVQAFIDPPSLPTIGIISPAFLTNNSEEYPPIPYIYSPPLPPLFAPRINPNIIMKSDGEVFEVVASGSAGWFGYFALAAILSIIPIAP